MMATKTKPTAKKLAEWWVLLNCWEWPRDLGHPPNDEYVDRRSYIRGAHEVVDAVADMGLVDEIWQDDDRRNALIERNRAL